MRLGFVSILAFAALCLGCQSKAKSAEPAPANSVQMAEKTAATAKAEAVKTVTAPSAAGSKLECANKADKRALEIRTKDKGCELAYTKNGQEAVIATAQNGPSHCEAKRDALAEKLKAAGFTCN